MTAEANEATTMPKSSPTIQILHRWTRTVLFEAAAESMKAALLMAISQDANLTRADLTGANLTDANLTDANLTGADLAGADLTGADLTDANLTRANLTGANLTGADLTGANLTRANLTRANLTRANLTGANLTDADLTAAKEDLFQVLSRWPAEVPALLAEVNAGRIDGSVYSGECSCLKGTIAKIKHTDVYRTPGMDLDAGSPAERWFMPLRPGHTPQNNPIAKITSEWIREWLATNPQPATKVAD